LGNGCIHDLGQDGVNDLLAIANDPTGSVKMTPDERLAEVSMILAKGVTIDQ